MFPERRSPYWEQRNSPQRYTFNHEDQQVYQTPDIRFTSVEDVSEHKKEPPWTKDQTLSLARKKLVTGRHHKQSFSDDESDTRYRHDPQDFSHVLPSEKDREHYSSDDFDYERERHSERESHDHHEFLRRRLHKSPSHYKQERSLHTSRSGPNLCRYGWNSDRNEVFEDLAGSFADPGPYSSLDVDESERVSYETWLAKEQGVAVRGANPVYPKQGIGAQPLNSKSSNSLWPNPMSTSTRYSIDALISKSDSEAPSKKMLENQVRISKKMMTRKQRMQQKTNSRFVNLDPVGGNLDGQSRRARNVKRIENRMSVAPSLHSDTHRIVVDFAFADRMSRKELNLLGCSLSSLQAKCKNSKVPLHIFFSSFSFHSAIHDTLEKIGLNNWAVEPLSADLLEQFDSGSLVYLTPNAENPLFKFDPQKVYVIGCNVDTDFRNTDSLQRAKSLGIESARLPLKEFCNLDNAASVLDINVVGGMIYKYYHSKDWCKVLKFNNRQRRLLPKPSRIAEWREKLPEAFD